MVDSYILFSLISNSDFEKTILNLNIDGRFPIKTGNDTIFEVNIDSCGCRFIKNQNILNIKGLKEEYFQDNQYSIIENKRTAEQTILQVKFTDGANTQYLKKDFSNLLIGKSKKMDIQLKHKKTNSHHATLRYHNKSLWIFDENSELGIYINKKRTMRKKLDVGDSIDILGCQIIIGYSCILLVEFENSRTLVKADLLYSKPLKMKAMHGRIFKLHPSAVYKPTIEENTITIDAPSFGEEHNEVPWIFTVGPALTMGFSSLSMAFFTIMNAIENNSGIKSILPTISMSFSMALGSLLWPIMMRKYERKSKKEKAAKDFEVYRIYLQQQKILISETLLAEKNTWNALYESSSKAIEILENEPNTLYYRKFGDPTFLSLVIGIGEKRPITKVEIPNASYEKLRVPIYQELKTYQESLILKKMAIPINLIKNKVIGIYGEYQSCFNYMLDKLLQLSILHHNRDLKLMIFMDKDDVLDSGVNNLMNVNSNDGKVRYIFTCEDDMKAHSIELANLINKEDKKDYYVLFGFRTNYLHRNLWFQELFEKPGIKRFSYIHMATNKEELSHHTTETISLVANKLFFQGNKEPYSYETKSCVECKSLIKKMNMISFFDVAKRNTSMKLTLLDLFRCGNVEQLNIENKWQYHDVTKQLEVPIGCNIDNELIYLDAHERAHGPHGLLAGMTGSGKSELLLTYIVSLMVHFSPNQVSFLFIDFKGGSSASLFKNSPHVAGILTNLQEDSLPRIFTSIQSEIQARQISFQRLQQNIISSSVDIDVYQQNMKTNKKLKPISHLFIIIDEFAELKEQESIFMDQIKQIARIGRSLGIHLLLATQKPSGVVDDQIWSNSRFHICMKVQDKCDSLDMLKRDDAVFLHQQGDFILQVGNNEIFTKGKGAWAQAKYFPQDFYQENFDKKIERIDLSGRVLDTIIFNNDIELSSQLNAVLNKINGIAQTHHIRAKSIWLSPLNNQNISEIISKYNFKGAIGLIDQPIKQCYSAFNYENLKYSSLWYGSKTEELLQIWKNCWYQLSTQLSQKEIQIFFITSSKHQFCRYQNYEIVQNILDYHDKPLIMRLLHLSLNHKNDFTIIIFINEISNFLQINELYEEGILKIIKNGNNNVFIHGICKEYSDLSYRTSILFPQNLVFTLSNINEYSNFFNRSEVVGPSGEVGSGVITNINTEHIQFALVSAEDEEKLLLKQSGIEAHNAICDLPQNIKYSKQMMITNEICIGLNSISHEKCLIRIKSEIIIITGLRKLSKKYVNIIRQQFIRQGYSILNGQTIERETSKQKQVYIIADECSLNEELTLTMEKQDLCVCIIKQFSKINNFLFSDFYQENLYDQHVCWVGPGFNANAFSFKLSTITNDDILDYQAVYINKKQLEIIQIFEGEKNE